MVGAVKMHSRVEFTTDLGFGPVVVAFVDFSSKGISFGRPYNVQIYEGITKDAMPNPAINEYHRVTVHVDGMVETHWPTPFVVPELKAFDQDTPSLAEWRRLWCRRFELTWAPDHIAFMKPWFTKPKPETHSTCLNVPLDFNPEVTSSVMEICVVDPQLDITDLPLIYPCNSQTWFLTGGSPWVTVCMTNVNCPGTSRLCTVGRDYRQSG